jgi:hypothetical protein
MVGKMSRIPYYYQNSCPVGWTMELCGGAVESYRWLEG